MYKHKQNIYIQTHKNIYTRNNTVRTKHNQTPAQLHNTQHNGSQTDTYIQIDTNIYIIQKQIYRDTNI